MQLDIHRAQQVISPLPQQLAAQQPSDIRLRTSYRGSNTNKGTGLLGLTCSCGSRRTLPGGACSACQQPLSRPDAHALCQVCKSQLWLWLHHFCQGSRLMGNSARCLSRNCKRAQHVGAVSVRDAFQSC